MRYKENGRNFSVRPLRKGRANRLSYANGYQPRRINIPSGSLSIKVPETAKHRDTPFSPSALKRGELNSDATQEAIATAYFQGAFTRNVGEILKRYRLDSVTACQVNDAVRKFGNGTLCDTFPCKLTLSKSTVS